MNARVFLIVFAGYSFCGYGQSNIVIKDKRTAITIDKGRLIVEEYRLIKINDKNSNWISEVSIHSSKRNKVEILEAVIRNTRGDVVKKLKKSEIKTRSDIESFALYEELFRQ